MALSTLRQAFVAHVIGSTARLRRFTSGRKSPAAWTTVFSACVGTEPASGYRSYFSRSRRWSPTRSEFAIAVSAGFTAPMLGKTLVSTT
jgi:hypothetical protein